MLGNANGANTGKAATVLGQIRDLLAGRQGAQPGAADTGPWAAMIRREAGPLRSQPIHGARPFNPAERRRGG